MKKVFLVIAIVLLLASSAMAVGTVTTAYNNLTGNVKTVFSYRPCYCGAIS
jgi:hypothetical protein